ncbi:MAG: SAM-dependent methyltransferase [Proteobacteria bacterium ST_bin11]|nr:MAG: SAM-dependent methyltransferase [Proteobacteria bacterium ST_bin11]
MGWATEQVIDLMERGSIPDAMIRLGIRHVLKKRLSSLPLHDPEAGEHYLADFIDSMARAPVAVLTEKANEQHYEVPEAFFGLVLGARRKYSCCLWPEAGGSLDQAEVDALTMTCERAGLADGQQVLELGCGWGSLSLWMAEHYPASRITAVSNSHSQREYITQKALALGLGNLEVITCDMNRFETDRYFDRIVSVEMFEHMQNWPALFARVADWLKPDGSFFMHVFCHQRLPYAFNSTDSQDWMGRYFFSGGIMPSFDLPLHFQTQLILNKRWCWDGKHYEKTANAWLENMDRHQELIWPILVDTYGLESAAVWRMRWRVFFMACAELWGFRGGAEWWVGHYRFVRRPL